MLGESCGMKNVSPKSRGKLVRINHVARKIFIGLWKKKSQLKNLRNSHTSFVAPCRGLSLPTVGGSATHLQVSPVIKTRMAQISNLFQKSLKYREAIFTTPNPSGSYNSCWEEKRGWCFSESLVRYSRAL